MTQQPHSRTIAVATATVLHVAIGVALFATAPARVGNAMRPAAGETVMAISFLPDAPLRRAEQRRPAVAPTSAVRDVVAVAARASPPRSNAAPTTPPAAVPGGITSALAAAPLAVDAGINMSIADVQSYRARLQSHLAQYRRYPLDARRDHVEGTVLIRFVIDRAGSVTSAWVDTSSGSGSLDREAIEAIARAQPLPPPPAGWPSLIDVTLPVAFGLG